MSTKRRGLAKGRGLEALLGAVQHEQTLLADQNTVPDSQLKQIPIHQLQRGKYQPRHYMAPEALNELAESIAQHGIMQPIVIRPIATAQDNATIRYEIIAGERRWRAAQQAGLTEIPAIVRDLSDQVAIALALIENIQRQDLNPMEQALALQRFHEEFGLSHQEIADMVGKARTTVSNLLRLLALDDQVKQLVAQNQLDMGHARALLGLKKPQQWQIAQQVIKKGLSVRQTEQLVRAAESAETVRHRPVDANIAQLNEKLTARLGATVQIAHNAKGQGKIMIQYQSLDQLEGILAICLSDETHD